MSAARRDERLALADRLAVLDEQHAPERLVAEQPGGSGGGDLAEAFEFGPVERRRLVVDRGVRRDRHVHDEEIDAAELHGIGRFVLGAGRGSERIRRDEPAPAFAGAVAFLVIAAHHDPGRGGEERRGGREEVGVPDFPSAADGASGAAVVRTVEQPDDPTHGQIVYANFITRGLALHDSAPWAKITASKWVRNSSTLRSRPISTLPQN